jgi:uncharacterized protein (TIGR02466 family)
MAKEVYFATTIHRARVAGARALNPELETACRVLRADDAAGRAWSAKHGYKGYTSYASLNDLAWRMPAFATLQVRLQPLVELFAAAADFDLCGRALTLDNMWVNILAPGGVHTGHIHPHSVISGVYYVTIPHGAAAIRFEDPRLTAMMAAPPRRARAQTHNRSFVAIQPTPGVALLWESWLRHEVLMNDAPEERISISFNYRWE